jgi:periplasmic divalent cation tolerance protein
MPEDDFIVVLCTVPDGDCAERLGRGLVESRLAACVNALPGVRSFYRWKGEIEMADEVQLLIKTRRSHFDRLQIWIGQHHPYDVPELVAQSVERVSESYAQWLSEQTA